VVTPIMLCNMEMNAGAEMVLYCLFIQMLNAIWLALMDPVENVVEAGEIKFMGVMQFLKNLYQLQFIKDVMRTMVQET